VNIEAWAPLAGRAAAVTGGASGIGAEIVQLFAAAGAGGTVLDRAVPHSVPEGWASAQADVKDEASLAEAFAGLERVDLLVAAAGIVPEWSSTETLDLAEWDEVLAVNARGVAATLLHAVPLMGDGGSIVVIASLNSWKGDPNLIAYAASKHAVLGVVRSVARDLGPHGIRINAVAPGPIATNALLERLRRREQSGGVPAADALAAAAAQTALGRIATARDVAQATLFLASDLSGSITGQLLPVDGGLA
jgi:NAD(P)-dependent dehydrogenase (short-subunit alcohol dehydrogenase family)